MLTSDESKCTSSSMSSETLHRSNQLFGTVEKVNTPKEPNWESLFCIDQVKTEGGLSPAPLLGQRLKRLQGQRCWIRRFPSDSDPFFPLQMVRFWYFDGRIWIRPKSLNPYSTSKIGYGFKDYRGRNVGFGDFRRIRSHFFSPPNG